MWRRLTATQFTNSLHALLGDVTVSAAEEDIRTGGFTTTGASLVVTSSDGVDKYQVAVDGALEQTFANATKRSALVSGAGCPPKVGANDACTVGFIKRFGRLAFRRPLSTEETTRYATVATSAAQALNDPYAGARWAASAILQSPKFLYRTELGEATAARPDARQLTSIEIASRLSFFLWNGPPDDALLTAAEAGQLVSVDGIRKEAQRLLDAPSGRQAITAFVRDFFWLDRLDKMAKDAGLYPQFTSTLSRTMGSELTRMWETVVFEQDGSALDLLTSRRTFVNKELATFYGLPTAGLTDAVMSPIELPATGGRVGFLGSAALLSLYADQKEGSPTLRGRFIREELLCQPVPPPPDNVNTQLKDPPPGVVYTKREKLNLHRSQAVCASCHGFMDPLGFPLESFDAVGAYRATEAGKPVDASGSLEDQTFNGLPGLAEALKKTPEVASCMVKHLYRYSTGAAESPGEDTAVEQLSTRFSSTGYRLRSLFLELVSSEGFRFQAKL